MYQLMIIDDEPETRNGIRHVINWHENNIHICAEASNGLEALDIIHDKHPDIILVDIHMPKMDGLEMLQTLIDEGHLFHAIVLSSYDEFEYAQQAMSLGVKNYLLKPSRPEQILASVKKVIREIESSKMLHQQAHRSNLLLKQQQLRYSLEGTLADFGRVILDPPNNMLIVVAELDYGSSLLGDNIQLMNFCLSNVLTETLSKHYTCDVLIYEQRVVAFCNNSSNMYESQLLPKLNYIQSYIYEHFKASVSIGISDVIKQIQDLRLGYLQAVNILEHRSTTRTQIIQKYQMSKPSMETIKYPVDLQNELVLTLFSGTSEDFHYSLEKFYSYLNNVSVSTDLYRQYCATILINMSETCSQRHMTISDALAKNVQDFLAEKSYRTKLELATVTKKIQQQIYEEINSKQHNNDIINLCAIYIKEHYDEDLSLEIVADHAHISPGYLSQLFKQVMDIKFIDYVNTIRIENACNLLKDKTLKTYEIALMVGYKTEKYFSKKFKQYMKLTPSAYRKNI